MDILKWLEKWYFSMCDGSWEHIFGVQIGTLDNPGWMVLIDIIDTPLEGKKFETIECFVDEDDWIHCQIKDGKFDGDGDPSKLMDILQIFKNWVESYGITCDDINGEIVDGGNGEQLKEVEVVDVTHNAWERLGDAEKKEKVKGELFRQGYLGGKNEEEHEEKRSVISKIWRRHRKH